MNRPARHFPMLLAALALTACPGSADPNHPTNDDSSKPADGETGSKPPEEPAVAPEPPPEPKPQTIEVPAPEVDKKAPPK